MRLTDFWGVSRECDEISWDPAKSNQFLTLDFFCKFYSRKVSFSQFSKHYFQNFLGSMPADPPRTGLKSFYRRCAARTFLPRNLTLNSYNKLANIYCNRFSTILYIISDNSLITLMKSGITTKYWFAQI